MIVLNRSSTNVAVNLNESQLLSTRSTPQTLGLDSKVIVTKNDNGL
jgi:hypothetical protein